MPDHHRHHPDPPPVAGTAQDPRALADLFAPAKWLSDLGRTSWFAVGIMLMVGAGVWVAAMTQTIVMPLIVGGVVAAVASPLVAWMERHHVPRGIGTALFLLGMIGVVVGIVVVVMTGIGSQSTSIASALNSAKDSIAHWLNDLGVSKGSTDGAKKDATTAVNDIAPTLLHGITQGIKQLSSLVFFLSLTALSLFFLLKDGREIRAWGEHHMRVPPEIAHGIAERVLGSLRAYFLGMTAIAVFNGVVVALGALILGVPLVGTIAIVTFVGAYIPYLGAWVAGAFSVLMALGGAGTDAAIGMIVVQLLANGILQQLIQPVAYGAALGIHPLAVLVVTIAGGAIFGTVGLILAAPLTAAITQISVDLRGRRPAPAAPDAPQAAPDAPPAAGAISPA